MIDNIYISFCQTNLNSSITMIHNGKIYGIELDRISRLKKFNLGEGNNNLLWKKYIHKGLEYLLKQIGNYSNYTIIGLFFCGDKSILDGFNYKYNICKEYYFIDFNDKISVKNFLYTYNLIEDHHYLHGLSSYFASTFEDAAILVFDGNGYDGEGSMGEIDFIQSLYYGNKSNIKLVEGSIYSEEKGLYGIGTLYELIPEIIGLEAGSVMGLSAYGNKDRFKNIKLFDYKAGDVYFFKKGIKFSELPKFILNIYGLNTIDFINKNKNITNNIFADIAAHLQYETEEAIRYLGHRAKKMIHTENICVSGGVGLNVLANRILATECGFKNIFIHNSVGDQGLSIGGLYHLYYIMKNNSFKKKLEFKSNIGKIYTNFEIDTTINKYIDKVHIIDFNINFIVDKLVKENIIGIFNEGSEFGPRALGFRSILSSPSINNNIRTNKIKNREEWRPLAPVILEKFMGDYLCENIPSPYMTLSSKVKRNKRSEINGVVHIDGTVRYQTVNKNNNELLYDILNNFHERTSIPVLINTSLNVKGEPIVETPENAIKLFLSTDLDYLIIGNKIIQKDISYPEFTFNYDENLFNITINSLSNQKYYLKIRKYLGILLFHNKDFKFSFIHKDILTYRIPHKNVDILISVGNILNNPNTGYYFNYKNIYYNIVGNKITIDYELEQFLNIINNIIKNNYKIISVLFLNLNNYDK